jgi:hypothetical protein
MKDAKCKTTKSVASYSLKHALLLLSGVGVVGAGYMENVNAQAAQQPIGVTKLSVEPVQKPKNILVKTPKT